MARPVDAEALEKKISEWLGQPGNGDYYSGYDAALCAVQDLIADTPTLTPPNEPLTLEELKAEAKRQGYKLIKATRPRFERCLCGHNVHQWCSRRGMEKMVYCKHCGLESPWVKGGNAAVIEAWNAMILEKRKEQING